MRDSYWPEACGVIAVAAATAIILGPWWGLECRKPLEQVFVNWDAVSAIGTLLAVIVSLAVPTTFWLLERGSKARDQALASLIANEELLAIAIRLDQLVARALRSEGAPKEELQTTRKYVEAGRKLAKGPSELAAWGRASGLIDELLTAPEPGTPANFTWTASKEIIGSTRRNATSLLKSAGQIYDRSKQSAHKLGLESES